MKVNTRLKCFWGHLKGSAARWFGPRYYLVAYTITRPGGELLHQSKVVAMETFDLKGLIDYLSYRTEDGSLVIDCISEIPERSYGEVLEAKAKAVKALAEQAAKELENSPTFLAKSSENASESKEPNLQDSIEDFIKHR